MTELDLRLFALQELQVVDDEQIDPAQRFLERERGLGLERGHEAVHEFFGGEIKRLALAPVACARDGLQQMGFPQAHAGVNVERIEHHGVAAPRPCDLLCGGMRQGV